MPNQILDPTWTTPVDSVNVYFPSGSGLTLCMHMKNPKYILPSSIAVLLISIISLILVVVKNRIIYPPVKTREAIENLKSNPNETYSKEYVLNLVELKYQGDEAIAEKDKGINEVLSAVVLLLGVSIILQINSILKTKKLHNQGMDPTR